MLAMAGASPGKATSGLRPNDRSSGGAPSSATVTLLVQPCEHFVAPVAHAAADAEAARSGAQVAPVAQGADGGAEQFGGFGDGEQIRFGRGGRGCVGQGGVSGWGRFLSSRWSRVPSWTAR